MGLWRRVQHPGACAMHMTANNLAGDRRTALAQPHTALRNATNDTKIFSHGDACTNRAHPLMCSRTRTEAPITERYACNKLCSSSGTHIHTPTHTKTLCNARAQPHCCCENICRSGQHAKLVPEIMQNACEVAYTRKPTSA